MRCNNIMHDHGWIDSGGNGQIVCPGNWIVAGEEGRYFVFENLFMDSRDDEIMGMLKRFAEYGEDEWDSENFRDGYKNVSGGDLVDCRSLLRKLGVDFD
jgi:hypothetical protein